MELPGVDQKPTVNLISKMDELPYYKDISVADIKSIIASDKDFDVNARNKRGETALMIACRRMDKDAVKFLLDYGADPNAQCEKRNTPMHHVICPDAGVCFDCSSFRTCTRFHSDLKPRLAILFDLVSYGAIPMYNHNGVNPPLLAALHQEEVIVELFVQRQTTQRRFLSDAEQIRALEVLGVTIALGSSRTPYIDPSFLKCALHFCKAHSIRETGKVTCREERDKSDIVAGFSLFADMEYTYGDWKRIETNGWAAQTQALLIGERVLPENMKEGYLLERLLSLARMGVSSFGNIEERLLQSTQIFRDALPWELNSKILLGDVLDGMIRGLHLSWKKPYFCDVLKLCLPVMTACLQVFNEASRSVLLDIHRGLLHSLGRLLLKLAASTFHKSSEPLELLLQYGVHLIRIIRQRCEKGLVSSITHYILRQGTVLSACSRGSVRSKERVKYLISKLIECEDASQLDSKSNTMLHSLMKSSILKADPQFVNDISIILIRHGCDVRRKPNRRKTVINMLMECPHRRKFVDPEFNELIMNTLFPPTSVLSLEEISARTILRHNIAHMGILPRHLSEFVTGNVLPEEVHSTKVLDLPSLDSGEPGSELKVGLKVDERVPDTCLPGSLEETSISQSKDDAADSVDTSSSELPGFFFNPDPKDRTFAEYDDISSECSGSFLESEPSEAEPESESESELWYYE